MDSEYPHIEEEIGASSEQVEFPENSNFPETYGDFDDNFVGLDNYVKNEPLSPSIKPEPMSPVIQSRDYDADIDILSQLCVVIDDSDGDEGMDSFTVQKEVVSMVLSDEEEDEEVQSPTLETNDTTVEEQSEKAAVDKNSDVEISDVQNSDVEISDVEISDAEDFNAWKVDRIKDVVLAEIDIDAHDNIGTQVGKSHVTEESEDDDLIGDMSDLDDDTITKKPKVSHVIEKEGDTSHVTNEANTSHVTEISDVIALSDSDDDQIEVEDVSHVTKEDHVTEENDVTPATSHVTEDHVMGDVPDDKEVSYISSDEEGVAEVTTENHVSVEKHVTSPKSHVTETKAASVSPQSKIASRTNSYLDKPFSVPFAKPGQMKEVTKNVATAVKTTSAKFTIRETGAWTNETLQLFAWRG